MRLCLRCLLLFLVAMVLPGCGLSQPQFSQTRPGRSSSPGGLSVGAFVAIGLENHDTPTQTSAVSIPVVGIYGEWGRRRLRYGLDIRGQGGTLGIPGLLVGPRLAVSFLGFEPYVEGLAGPNHTSIEVAGRFPGATEDRHGVTIEAATGVDFDLTEHVRWRVAEFTAGRFSGVPGSRPIAFTTGFVFHLP